MLATVVSEAKIGVFGDFLKILYPATCKGFVVFNAVLCIIWIIASTIL